MAQATSLSVPQGRRGTSFLSFDDAPNSPNTANLDDTDATQSYSANSTISAAPTERDQVASPTSPKRWSDSNRGSPSKVSRFIRLRPATSNDTNTAASADTGEASNHSDMQRSSPTRTSAQPLASRGSRLGALLGRTLPSTDAPYSRNGASPISQAEGSSSKDTSFFGRRIRSKSAAANDDIDEIAATSLAAPGSPPKPSQETTVSSSLASSNATSDQRSILSRPPRRSSQANLLDSFANSAGPSTSTAPQQTRVGRLGRLTYKKDDSISFIAQSRNAPQQTGTAAQTTADAGRHQHQWSASSRSSAGGAIRGLGIDDVAGPYASARSSNSSFVAAGHPPERYEDAADVGEHEQLVGVASSRMTHQASNSLSNGSSRAPSVTGTYGANYHKRFSRQGMSQEVEHDTSHDSETRTSESPTDVHTAPAMEPGTSYDRSSRSPRGTLSDAAIAELGAMPGASAGSLLNSNGAPLSSKNILTIALQKAQNAVQLDSANNVPEAIAAYKQAVRLLEEVMDRIAPRSNRRSRPTREEERRRLRVIHDTYADRIRLLSMIYSPDVQAIDEMEDAGYGYNPQQAATRADWLDRVRDDSQQSPIITTPRLEEDFMDMNSPRSPQEDTASFLSVTPVRTAFTDPSFYAATQPAPSSQSKHPFPRSPPVPNAPLSPEAGAVNTSPRRRVREHARVNSRESHGSRASVSLSIADEQDAQQYRLPPPVIAEETPLISIEAALSDKAEKRLSSPRKSQLRGAVTQVRESEALSKQHGRSDSDSSFKSTTTGSRLKPVPSLPHRAFGLDDEVRTPNTPYFDASTGASTSISPVDPQKPQPELPLPPLPDAPSEAAVVDPPAEKPAKMGFAQRARALSFKGPLLRQKVSMPSLGERKKDDTAAAGGAAVPAVPSLRPGLNRMPSSGALSASQAHPTPWDDLPSANPDVRSGSNRPRAATSAAALVSASTAAGTISQRRKGAQAEDPSVRGLSDELQELALADEAGSYESGGAKSIAMTNRQRSASQTGSRRPSIPAAFVAANGMASAANAEGTGEDLPPPVPDLARTLSALERKRASDERALAIGTGAEVSHSTLAMPLPRPHLGELDPANHDDTTRFLITDIFPTGLPSLAAGAPSYASAPLSSPPPLSPTLLAPAHPLLKPFLTLTLLRASILSGSQLTPTLYLPRAIWRQPGAKLVGIETKVRAIELLLSGLDTLERAGEPLLLPLGTGAGLETSSGTRWLRSLDEWESVLGDVQTMLGKKLPFLDTAGAGGKKLGGLGSRFARSIDRMTGAVGQVKSVDAAMMGGYADGLVRLAAKATLLGTHLHWALAADGILPPPSSPPTAGSKEAGGTLQSPTGVGTAHANRTAYFALPAQMREDVKARLKRSSEFMGRVVLVWVLQDVGVLVERRLKKSGGVFGD